MYRSVIPVFGGSLLAAIILLPLPAGGQQPVTFPAADGATVYGYWYRSDFDSARAVILTFHQGNASGRAEYGPIAPRLNAAGYDVLAIDQRSGGNLFGGVNRTVRDGEPSGFCEVAPDLAGTLAYAREARPGVPVILWGSSYSGALALRLAATDPRGVVGVLGFSPASGGPMAECRGEDVSGQIEIPVLVLRPRAEMERESSATQFEILRAQGHTTFVADPGTHGSSMLVADRVDGSVEETWTGVMSFLSGLDGHHLMVLSRQDDEAVFHDLDTGAIIARVPVGTGAHEVSVDPGGGRALVASYGGNTVHAIDLETRSVVAAFELPPHSALHGIRTSATGELAWVTAEESSVVLEVDVVSGQLLRSWPTRGYRSHMVTSTPDDRKLYVANIDSGTVSVIDRVSGALTVLPTGAGAEGIDIDPRGREVWVSNRADNTISVIDTETDRVKVTISSQGDFPVKVRFRPDGAEVWVSNNRSGEVAVFDAVTREWLASIPVGVRPLGIVFSADGQTAFVSLAGTNEAAEIDVVKREIIRRFATGTSPDGMAWVW